MIESCLKLWLHFEVTISQAINEWEQKLVECLAIEIDLDF